MKAKRVLAAGLGGYLIGSFSFARLAGRRFAPGADLSDNVVNLPGDANINYGGVSATSIAIRGGPAAGIATGVLDMSKAYVPVLLTKRAFPERKYHLIVALATMVGHIYPIYHRFKGGRGQTPFYGGLLAIDPVSVPVTTVAGSFVGLVIARDMAVAYSAGMWMLIPWFAWRRQPAEVAYATAASALFMLAMAGEFRSYLEKRRSGELQQISSFKELMESHPAVRGDRDSAS